MVTFVLNYIDAKIHTTHQHLLQCIVTFQNVKHLLCGQQQVSQPLAKNYQKASLI